MEGSGLQGFRASAVCGKDVCFTFQHSELEFMSSLLEKMVLLGGPYYEAAPLISGTPKRDNILEN